MTDHPRHIASDYLASLTPAELRQFMAEALPRPTPAEQFARWAAGQFDPETSTIPLEETQP